MVTVALNNGKLLQLFKKKRFLENEMRLEAIEEKHFAALAAQQDALGEEALLVQISGHTTSNDGADIGRSDAGQAMKPCFKRAMEALGLDKTLEYYFKQHQAIKDEIDTELRRHANDGYSACKVGWFQAVKWLTYIRVKREEESTL